MSQEHILLLIKIGKLLVELIVGGILGYIVYLQIVKLTSKKAREKLMMRTIEIIDKRGKLSNSQKDISKRGISYRRSDNDNSPAAYLLFRLFFGLVFALIGVLYIAEESSFNIAIPAILFIAGFFGIDMYYSHENENDNKEITKDMYSIYSNLKIQLSSGIFIVSAIDSCTGMVKNKRLKKAMNELVVELSSSRIANADAVKHFEDKFTSKDIQNFCIFLNNYYTYGVTESYLSDIMNEINDIAEATALQQEHDTDTKTGAISMMFFADIIMIIAYGMTQAMDLNQLF